MRIVFNMLTSVALTVTGIEVFSPAMWSAEWWYIIVGSGMLAAAFVSSFRRGE